MSSKIPVAISFTGVANFLGVVGIKCFGHQLSEYLVAEAII